jgi:hypothetical protein
MTASLSRYAEVNLLPVAATGRRDMAKKSNKPAKEAAPPTYPVDRWIRLTNIDRHYVPAFAPNAKEDVLEAYAPFLYDSEQAVQKEFAGDMAERWAEIERGERDFDDSEIDDRMEPCTVHDDGLISTQDDEITREQVFQVYAMADVAKLPTP